VTMQLFSGREYLKIDIASNFGLDKENWDDRIAWFDENEKKLDSLLDKADEPALYYAGCQAWRKANANAISRFPISLDATCSGIQILAALSGDRKAASICNVIDTGKREDAYTSIYQEMVEEIGGSAKIERKQTKQAIMTAFYSSTAIPKAIFGEGLLLDIFYKTMKANAPGPWEINETMLNIWDPRKLTNNWVLPDNFHVVVKVMSQVKERIHFLDAPYDVVYNINAPHQGGRSLGANMTHSIDGMIVREILRRCKFDPKIVGDIRQLVDRKAGGTRTGRSKDRMVQTLWNLYLNSGFLSSRILDYLDIDNLGLVQNNIIKRLVDSYPAKPFDVMTIHDCFRCLPNYGNDLRIQYANILAEITDSRLLSWIISQITGRRVPVTKLDEWLGKDVRKTNYALS
jgi:hypothetical protein